MANIDALIERIMKGESPESVLEQGVDIPAVERRVETVVRKALADIEQAIRDTPPAVGTLSARLKRMSDALVAARDALRKA